MGSVISVSQGSTRRSWQKSVQMDQVWSLDLALEETMPARAAACAERKSWRKASRVFGVLNAKRRSEDSGDRNVREVLHQLVSIGESNHLPWR
jgi:hypothetical protein